jgi:DNA polymerase (family X)
VQMARASHVRVVISTDAHRPEELRNMRHGVDQARRGWCEARDVANTYPLKEFRTLLRKGR